MYTKLAVFAVLLLFAVAHTPSKLHGDFIRTDFLSPERRLPPGETIATIIAASSKVEGSTLDHQSALASYFEERAYLKVSNWASAGGLNYLVPAANATVTLEAVFYGISALLFKLFDPTGGAGALLTRTNLFHGHFVRDTATGHDLLVTHAFEYPIDIPSPKSDEIRNITGEEEFSTDDRVFKLRNAIYSFTDNTLTVPDFATCSYKPDHSSAYCGDMAPDPTGKALTLSPEALGEWLGDVNLFPELRRDELFLCVSDSQIGGLRMDTEYTG